MAALIGAPSRCCCSRPCPTLVWYRGWGISARCCRRLGIPTREPLWGPVCPFPPESKAVPRLAKPAPFWPGFEEFVGGKKRSRRKARRSLGARPTTTARSAGSFRTYKRTFLSRKKLQRNALFRENAAVARVFSGSNQTRRYYGQRKRAVNRLADPSRKRAD